MKISDGRDQADAERHVDPVGEALAHGGAQDLDDPEPHGDLGHLVQQHAPGLDGLGSRCLVHDADHREALLSPR